MFHNKLHSSRSKLPQNPHKACSSFHTLRTSITYLSSMPAMLINDNKPTPERLMCSEKQKKTAIEIPRKADCGRYVTGVGNVLA